MIGMNDLILGIDEVGRGAWAGPLVVGAVVLEQGSMIEGLDDSKKLSKKRREELNVIIKNKAKAIGIGWVDAKTIDQIGLSASLKLSAERALAQIPKGVIHDLQQIIIDGTVKLIDDRRAITMIKADGKIKAVSAGSIVAKVARDHYMTKLSKVFTGYDFSSHVGYGTSAHSTELSRLGAIKGIHRKSFAPIAKIIDLPSDKKEDKLANTVGRRAENEAAEHLKRLGHTIIEQNWKTKLCEIDIISITNGTLYFHEVKYRKDNSYGDGLSAITKAKIQKMEFAAKIYLQHESKKYLGMEICLSAISMSGNPPKVDTFIENIF